jgi:arylsulfatase A-like enzyme
MLPPTPRPPGLAVALCAVAALGCSSSSTPSVLVVSMDTFRADRMGALDSQGRSLTPALDELAEDSLVFTRAYAQGNETLYSHASLFTGRYPSELGPLSYERFRLPPDAGTFAAYLAQDGYRTEAVVAGGHLTAHFGHDAGFHRYQSMEDFSTFHQTLPAALERLDALAASGSPFLLLVHGYDAHSPYVKAGPLFRLDTPGYDGPMLSAARNPFTYERVLGDHYYPDFEPSQVSDASGNHFLSPDSFDELEAWAEAHPRSGVPLDPADLDFLLASYDAAVRHADLYVGMLLDHLDALGIAEETIVVVLSDHGECLLERGHFNHRFSLHDENTHVPLLVRAPGLEPARHDEPVALVDVAPTLLELTGGRERAGRGISLLHPEADRAVYSESMRGDVSVRSDEGRLIVRRDGSVGEDGEGGWLGDDLGEPLDWDDHRRSALERALRELRP